MIVTTLLWPRCKYRQGIPKLMEYDWYNTIGAHLVLISTHIACSCTCQFERNETSLSQPDIPSIDGMQHYVVRVSQCNMPAHALDFSRSRTTQSTTWTPTILSGLSSTTPAQCQGS